jgi:hypothetical protein
MKPRNLDSNRLVSSIDSTYCAAKSAANGNSGSDFGQTAIFRHLLLFRDNSFLVSENSFLRLPSPLLRFLTLKFLLTQKQVHEYHQYLLEEQQ